MNTNMEGVCHLLVWIASAAHIRLSFTLWVGFLWPGPSVMVAVTPQPPLPRSCLAIILLGGTTEESSLFLLPLMGWFPWLRTWEKQCSRPWAEPRAQPDSRHTCFFSFKCKSSSTPSIFSAGPGIRSSTLLCSSPQGSYRAQISTWSTCKSCQVISLNTAPKHFPLSLAVAYWAWREVATHFFSKFNLPTVCFGGKCAGVGLRQTGRELYAPQRTLMDLRGNLESFQQVWGLSEGWQEDRKPMQNQNEAKPCEALCSTSPSCSLY